MPDDAAPPEDFQARMKGLLEKNGNMPVDQWRRIMLELQWETYLLAQPLPKRIENLERKNLLMLAEKHPKATAAFAAGFFLMLELWHSAAWRPWLSKLFGIPIP